MHKVQSNLDIKCIICNDSQYTYRDEMNFENQMSMKNTNKIENLNSLSKNKSTC